MAKQNKSTEKAFDPIQGFFDFIGGLGRDLFAGQPFSDASGGLAPGSTVTETRDRVRAIGRSDRPGGGLTFSPQTVVDGVIQQTGPGGPILGNGEEPFAPGGGRGGPPRTGAPAAGRSGKTVGPFTLGERAFRNNTDFSTFAAQQGFLPQPGNRGPFAGERGGVPSFDQAKPTTGAAGLRGVGGTINLIPALDDTAIDSGSPAGVFLGMMRAAQDANPGFDPFNTRGYSETDLFDPADIQDSLQQFVDQAFDLANGDPRLAILRFQNAIENMLRDSTTKKATEFDARDLPNLGPDPEIVSEDPTAEEAVFGSIIDPRFLRQPSTEF